MMRLTFAVLAGVLANAQTLTKDGLVLCPIKGQQFPTPSKLAQEPIWQAAARSLEKTLEANLTQAPYNETTFSVGVFSTTDEELLLDYHHSDPGVADSRLGAKEVDADSIYRIASISKVLTVYLWLVHDGHRRLSDPIIEHVPQLAAFDDPGVDYPLPNWNDITVGDLMGFLAGMGRDYGLNDIAIRDSVTEGFSAMAVSNLVEDSPPLERPLCGYFVSGGYAECHQNEYLRGLARLGASFPPAYTPSYSNANFALLGYALTNLLNSSMELIFNNSLIEPLNLTGTTYSNPQTITSNCVIPGDNTTSTGWDNALGPLNPAAGAFSTTNDLAKIGRAILSSTLTSKSTTRRWFTTTTFVETIEQATGLGWEIFRLKSGGHTVELYSKSGYWGIYTSVFAIIPDYDIGFSILTASSNATGDFSESFPNVLVPILLEAVEKIAREHADRNFAGLYSASDSPNTSIALATDDLPGLKLTSYISNGTDLMSTVFELFGKGVDFRLVPNHLFDDAEEGKVGFTGVYAPPLPPAKDGDFYFPCQTWLDIDDFTYGSVPLGNFVFEIDEDGKAGGVELMAFKRKLRRVGS